MTKIFCSSFFVFFLILLSCCSSGSDESGKDQPQTVTEEDDFGPPFDDTCLCSFDRLGQRRIGNHRMDLFICGYDWDPKYYSCTFTFGEFINNEFPPDSIITDYRIHLVDLKPEKIKINDTFLVSRSFNENLIATYSKSEGEKDPTCKFDPNKTGKYPKPAHWID